MGKTKTKTVERARRADNGQYTTKEYAKKHPDTTIVEKKEITKIKKKIKIKKKK